MVFHNQFTSPDGSDRHGCEQTLGQADLFEELQVDLPARPAHIAAVAISEPVKPVETFGHSFLMSASRLGSLIQAAVGSAGGTGRRWLNRAGFAA